MIGRATLITNWIVYYISLYLAKNYDTALEVFDSIVGMYADDKNILKPHEMSEIYLFKVNILVEMGENKKAIKFITKKTSEKAIMDDVRKNEILANLYLQNNQRSKAIECLETLLKLNSSNAAYYKQILEAKEATGDDEKTAEALKMYEEVLPKSNTHLRLMIDVIHAGPLFKSKLEKFIRPLITKGVPSLINDLKKTVYGDKAKSDILGEMLTSMCTSMEKEMVLDSKDEEEQDPTVQLWLYYYLS